MDQSSFTNEQRRLHELLEKKAITQEEFEERKQKLLNELKEPTQTEIYNVSNESSLNGKREVSYLLFVGILFLPIIFVWYLFRTGHSTFARVVGFVYLIISIVLYCYLGFIIFFVLALIFYK